VLLGAQAVIGFMTEYKLQNNQWNYCPAKWFKNIHMYLGWTLLLAS